MQNFEADPAKLARRKLVNQLFSVSCLLAASLVVVVLIVLLGTIFGSASTSLTFETSLPRLMNTSQTEASKFDGVTSSKKLKIKIQQGTGPEGSTATIFAKNESGDEKAIGTGAPKGDGSFEIVCDELEDGQYEIRFVIAKGEESSAQEIIEESKTIDVTVDTKSPTGLSFDESTLGNNTVVAAEMAEFVIGGSGLEEGGRVEVLFEDGKGNQLGPVKAQIKDAGRWRIPKTDLKRLDAGEETPATRGDLIVKATHFDQAGNEQKPIELKLAFDRDSTESPDMITSFDDDDVDHTIEPIEPIIKTNVKTFLTSHHYVEAPEVSGIFRALVGSMLLCGVCAMFTIPIGIGTAIFLEDFKPKNKILRAFHGFIQLNISNLAGVPSIVYGILGVTAFVYMFSLFPGKQVDSNPEYEFGANYEYQFETFGGQICCFKKKISNKTLFHIQEPIEVMGDEGDFMLNIVESREEFEELSKDEKYNTIIRNHPKCIVSQDDSKHHWYYVALPFGKSFLAAGLTLGLVVLPIIIIASQEAIRAVPDSLREASMGMGATKWQTVRNVVLPSATPGIMTGTILALSRAIGEAAPILAVMGGVLGTLPKNMMENSSALPILIYKWAKDSSRGFHSLSAAAIVVLLLLLLIMNSVAIVIRYRAERKNK